MVLLQYVSQFFGHLITIFNVRFMPQDAASKLKDVDIIRDLDIEGELIAAFRGKELIFAIDKVLNSYFYTMVMPTFNLFEFIFRVCYSLEGHCFWVPTATYDTIVSYPPVQSWQEKQVLQHYT